jgi:hypothetical protein
MLFNSLSFAIFFPLVATLSFLLPWRARTPLLLVSSCIFYMAFVPAYHQRQARQNGLLIFATHDITDSPGRFGCTPTLFERIVRHSIRYGAKTLPVSEALQIVGGTPE